MVGRLSPLGTATPAAPAKARRRAWLLLALALPVLALHACIGDAVSELRQGWSELAEMPPRLSVSYVRELQQSRPAPASPTAPPRQHRSEPAAPPVSPPGPARSASAVESPQVPEAAEAVEHAASAPERAQPSLEPVMPEVALPVRPAASSPVDPVPDTAAAPGPEWPPSTRLRYELTGNYRGAVTGEAQVEWIREGSRYQVHLDVSVGPSFAPLISRRMSSDGRLTTQGIEPQRYDEDTRVLFSSRRRVSVLFQGEQLTLANGRVEASAPGMQDAASQFVQLTWLFLTGRETLREGLILELPLALPRRQYRWRYEVLGRETLATPMGELETWHLKPTVTAGGGDLTAEVWLAPTLQYLPVRLRIRQDEQTFIDLMLKAPPAQAAPPIGVPPIVKPRIEAPNPQTSLKE
ncbi:DUF3108 domain-containing protein [Roseateles sp.]|uniref:DUF3108 domain-containing protein n=1 Tax=Roseateles sp. TaxID=1971397 RepID=UPI003D13447B